MPAPADQPAPLLPLREEIAIFPGPIALDGSPTWTLHDPVRNRFYRLGWRECEIITRWDAGTAAEIATRIAAETTLRVDQEDIQQLARFLFSCDLLRAASPSATDAMLGKWQRQRSSWGRWLLHNYLFMRIPLFWPDRFLTAAYPYVSFVYSRAFALAIVATGTAGLFLVIRQWDNFLATFVDMLSLQGAVYFGMTLAGLKAIHEFGHAFTAKRFGCRVPTMGVALLVMIPVLYTDANDAWKLTSRGQRLAIGLAGVAAELCCAAIAALAWGFLPNGTTRSLAFLIATSTWLTTILLNLSPFMRYDGYYVLSDYLELPNLHSRAFALAQWWMREKLLGLGDPPPEELPPRRRDFLVAFALLTWLYRFSLFLGIAAIIYAFAVKVLGVAMMVVEIGYFVLYPVLWELSVWWTRRADLRWSRRTILTAGVGVAVVVALLVPWRSSIDAPAMLKSRQHVGVFVPEFGARVAEVNVRNGDAVEPGAMLVRLVSPDLDYKLAQARTTMDILEWQIGAGGANADLLARSLVTAQEYSAALAEYRALSDQKARLNVTGPMVGMAVDVADGLDPGTWLPPKTQVLSVIDPAAVLVEAYVDEADLDRIAKGASAVFFAEADSRLDIALKVDEIAPSSTRVLTDQTLASVFGGPITVRATKQNTLIPDRTIYRVRFTPVSTAIAPERMLRGTVLLQGRPVSLLARAWRVVLAVIIRESGA
jgi:putative peptide zinc metalloprotease protein